MIQIYLFVLFSLCCYSFKINNFRKTPLLKLNGLKHYDNCPECNDNEINENCENCDNDKDDFYLFEKYSALQNKTMQEKYLIKIYKNNLQKNIENEMKKKF
tara:strand:+ start:43 stop:345 length:303 start_codon:yes stop_codon:yes gene_type:complete